MFDDSFHSFLGKRLKLLGGLFWLLLISILNLLSLLLDLVEIFLN